MVLFKVFIVALAVVHVHENRFQVHRTDREALSTADTLRILNHPVLFLCEVQHTGNSFDRRCIKAGCADAHHRSAEDDLARILHESAAMLGKIAERGSDSRQGIARSFHGAAAYRYDALDHGLALITGLVDRVAGSGTDNRTADSGRQSAGFDLTSGNCLDLHLLSALRVFYCLGHDLDPVLFRVKGIQQVDRVLLVDFDAVICLVHPARNPDQLNPLQQLFRVIQHRQVITVEVRLAFGAVDDQFVDLADAAANLEGRREHRAAHADDACLTHPGQDGFGVFQLFFRQRGQIVAWRILKVVFDDNRHDHIAEWMRSWLHCNDRPGNRSMNRCRNRCWVLPDLLAHFHIVALCHQRFARSANVLNHRDHHQRRRCHYRNRHLWGLHVVGMNTALKRMGHMLHLVK